ATQNSAYAASTKKIQCHEPLTRSQPPASGARIGATPMTSIMSDSTRADWMASKRSRITARMTTMPAEPPSAWAKRSSTKLSMLWRSEEHTSELQSHLNLVCRLLLEKKKKIKIIKNNDYD